MTPEKPKLLTVSGLSAVTALFAAQPDKVKRLAYTAELQYDAGPFCKIMAQYRQPYRLVEESELTKIAGTPLHGGIVAAMAMPAIYDASAQQICSWAGECKTALLLDGIGNPHNFGAIARSAAFFGIKNLLISDHPKQAGFSSAAWRVAEGGFSFLNVQRARNLPSLLRDIAKAWHVVATVAEGGKALSELPRDKPILLVLGNEESGLSQIVVAATQSKVTLRGSGKVQSLNVAQTAAILIHGLA